MTYIIRGVTIFIGLFILVGCTWGLKCYKCNPQESVCDKSNNSNENLGPSTQCDDQTGSCLLSQLGNVTIRDCLPMGAIGGKKVKLDGCVKTETEGIKGITCYCSKDNCNDNMNNMTICNHKEMQDIRSSSGGKALVAFSGIITATTMALLFTTMY